MHLLVSVKKIKTKKEKKETQRIVKAPDSLT